MQTTYEHLQIGAELREKYHKYNKPILNLTISLGGILFAIFLLPKLLGFFMPFIIGGIIAAIANPPVKFLETKLKIKRKASTVVVIIVVIAIVCGLLYLGTWILIKQSIGFVQSLPALWETTQEDFRKVGDMFDRFMIKAPVEWRNSFEVITEKLSTAIADALGGIGSNKAGTVGSVVGNIATAIINIIMGALSAYFFIADKDYLTNFVKKHISKSIMTRWDVVYTSMKQAVGGYFKAQFRIEIWIYLLVVLGLSILRINYAILIGLGIAILDFLPVFGTGTVMLPWAIIRLLSGDYFMGIGLLIIWGGGQLIRQLIQPKIMGDSIGMPPIPTLFLLYIGYKLSGVFGMIIAVPIGIIVVNMNEAGLFDTAKLSMKLLIANINQYRKLDEDDFQILDGIDSEADEDERKRYLARNEEKNGENK